ncbi:hypothetical protein LCGC14_1109880 [marine sediment metagenome]|uniref:Uncharacterized protein n=1 Tax=marine sediment metagenome TaxID=412755 RepID=A0A0F9MBT8_9ZZZZ
MNTRWTAIEDRVLERGELHRTTVRELQRRLPGRSVEAINCRRRRLGLHRPQVVQVKIALEGYQYRISVGVLVAALERYGLNGPVFAGYNYERPIGRLLCWREEPDAVVATVELAGSIMYSGLRLNGVLGFRALEHQGGQLESMELVALGVEYAPYAEQEPYRPGE